MESQIKISWWVLWDIICCVLKDISKQVWLNFENILSVWKWLKIIVSISILMSFQKIYVLFIFKKPIQYRICQIVISKIWWKIYMELENWNCQYERLQKGWLYTGWFTTRHPDRWGGSLKKLQHKYVNVNDSINEV